MPGGGRLDGGPESPAGGPPGKSSTGSVAETQNSRGIGGNYHRAVFIQPMIRRGEEWVELRPEEGLLARSQPEPGMARGNLEASIFQWVKLPNSSGLERAITWLENEPPIAYTPENRFHPELSTYRHIVATGGIGGRENTEEGINEVTLHWEVALTLKQLSQRVRRADPARAGQLLQQSRNEWASIAQRFPKSKYWLYASFHLASGQDPALADAVFVEAGGVPVQKVLSGEIRRIREDSIPLQYRDYLADVYYRGRLQTDDPQVKLRIVQFVRVSFPTSGTHAAMEDIKYSFISHDGVDDERDQTPAVVQVTRPGDGAQIYSGESELVAVLHDGDVRARQINLGDSSS